MRKKLFVAAFLFAASSTSAFTADAATDYSSSSFDWEGFYIGLNGGLLNTGTTYWGIGGLAGLNFRSDDFVFGVEGEITPYFDGGGYQGSLYEITARGGVLVSEDALVYAVGGVVSDGGAFAGLAGFGAEFVAYDNVTIGGEYNYLASGGGHEINAKVRWYMN